MERKKYYEYRIAVNKHITIKSKVEITIPIGNTIKEAVQEAKEVLAHVDAMANAFCEEHEDKEDPEMRELLQDISYQIMETAVKGELM